ncbi:nitroreductase family protein [Paraburkholderia strydomiana]|uniref:hypothetical protein n=1 Tax=Paraburkholderia strydomiana TaxID=1245417 RepID=UPI0038BBC872
MAQYLYDAPKHRLVLKEPGDARGLMGYQEFVGEAPLDLEYVVNMSRVKLNEDKLPILALTVGTLATTLSSLAD